MQVGGPVRVSALVPAYNETCRVGQTVRKLTPFADDVLVIGITYVSSFICCLGCLVTFRIRH